jgi:predicted transcriptional regulator
MIPNETDSIALLDQVAREFDLASALFHRINRIIPVDQKVLTVPPSCEVRIAIDLMVKHGYSQLPVVQNGEVLGVFSYRSFAKGAAKLTLGQITRLQAAPADLSVDEFLEQFQFARVKEEMSNVFEAADRDNGILVGSPDRLIGVLTPMDFLRYLYRVASPFVLLSEIELALRALIRAAFTEEEIAAAARRSLVSKYGVAEKVPLMLEGMTFEDYQSLIAHSDNWTRCAQVFGGIRARVSAKLSEVRQIRNDLFHFKRDITLGDHQTLAEHRNWLLSKVKQLPLARPDGPSVPV